MLDFGDPLSVDVLEAVGQIDCETHENDVCVGVREGTQAIVVFLA